MRKVSTLVLVLVSGIVNAANVSPYISGKISLVEINKADIDLTKGSDGKYSQSLIEDTGVRGQKYNSATFGYSLGYGFKFENNFRTDIEVSSSLYNEAKQYQIIASDKNDKDSHSGKKQKYDKDQLNGYNANMVTSFMTNVYYDLLDSAIVPYVQAGLGVAHFAEKYKIKGDKYKEQSSTTKFAYQIGTGIAYNLENSLTLDLGYKYMGTKNNKFNDKYNRFRTHTFSFGVRYGL